MADGPPPPFFFCPCKYIQVQVPNPATTGVSSWCIFFGIVALLLSLRITCHRITGDWRYEVRRALWERQQQLEQQERAGTNCAPNTMDGFPTISHHRRIVCIELWEEMKELRKQNEELKETVKKLRVTMEEMKEKWEKWERW